MAIMSIVSVVLWAVALNLQFVGLLLALKKIKGSALVFSLGMLCLVILFVVGAQAHVDVTRGFVYGGATLPIGASLFIRYIKN